MSALSVSLCMCVFVPGLIAGPTWYANGAISRCPAVAKRAQAIPAEYANKARKLDVQFCGVARGAAEAGPVTRKLLSFGRIQAVVFGAFGEGSRDAHGLVDRLASRRAAREWVRLGCRDEADAKEMVSRSLYRSWGIAALRAQARLKLSGLSHVGSGAQAASQRRSLGASYHARLREAHALQFRGRRGRRS